MKKFFLAFGLIAALLLSGCGASTPGIAALSNCYFQYNRATDDYSVFFELLDKSGHPISANVDVGIKIVNDENEKLYNATKAVSAKEYGYYKSEADGEQYLASVRIPASEIKAGRSASGKVYLTVYSGEEEYKATCSVYECLPVKRIQIETLVSWTFQENPGANEYSLFFGLLDENDNPVAMDANVDIRIVNDKDEEVYAAKRTVVASDYSYYTSKVAGESFLANVRIPASEIKEGKSKDGKVYLKVYKNGEFEFDEVNCDTFLCLPVKDIELTFDEFPLELKLENYLRAEPTVIQIQGAEYKFDKDGIQDLTVSLIGEVISGSTSLNTIYYKLYDSAGYVVDSGMHYLPSLSAGDKFKSDSLVIFNLTPGEAYTLKLLASDT